VGSNSDGEVEDYAEENVEYSTSDSEQDVSGTEVVPGVVNDLSRSNFSSGKDPSSDETEIYP